MKLNFLRRGSALLLALTLMLSMVTIPAAAADPLTVELSKTTLSLLADTDPEQLTVTVKDGETAVSEPTLNWTSSDTAIAAVAADGKVTPVAAGTATITVTATYTHAEDGIKTGTATCTVTVVPQVTSLALSLTEDQKLAIGQSLDVTAFIEPEESTEPLVWSLKDSTAGTVVTLTDHKNKTATITGKAPGNVTVHVATADGEHEASCKVAVSGIWLEKTEVKLFVGDMVSLGYQTFGNAPAADTMEWSSSNISVAEVENGKIVGHYPGTATITATVGAYTAECKVTVEEDVAVAITRSVDAGVELSFADLMTDLNNRCLEKTKAALDYVSGLQVSTEQGILYYGFASPDSPGSGVGSEQYHVNPTGSQSRLADVSFVGRTDFGGVAVISYSGRSVTGISFTGSIRVTVNPMKDVAYSTAAGRPVYFETQDFAAVCHAKTGREIMSISFTPPSARVGTLHYGYSETNPYNPEVSSETPYYRTKYPYLDEVAFLPADGYTGTVEIPYRVTTSGGIHTGTITVIVYDADGEQDGIITYDVASDRRVRLDADDFNDVCIDLTGASLSYVYFSLPAANEGELLYNYVSTNHSGSSVSANTRYFRASSPRISNVTFVPADSFFGTAKVPFTGYSTTGERFKGELVIHVEGTSDVISYTSSYGEAVEFVGMDFNEVCLAQNNTSLDYICFELPSSSRGTLYRGNTYTSGNQVNATTKFYRGGGSYQIDDVVFVPKKGYVGTVEIPFSGYDVSGGRVSGVVEITVSQNNAYNSISYKTVSGGLVDFDVDDFDLICQLLTGQRLRSVRFKLPATDQGTLYYNYNDKTGNGTKVYETTEYFRSGSRLISDVSFLADSRFEGVLQLEYMGTNVSGKLFRGDVEITVLQPGNAVVRYSGSSAPIVLQVKDFENACLSTIGRELSHIRFTSLPHPSMGRLYADYVKPAAPGTAVTVGTDYYVDDYPAISQLTFVPRAEYQGTVTFSYVGCDTRGKTYQGSVSITLSPTLCTTPFADLGQYAWAKPSIEYLRQSGITSGYNTYTFGPGRQISRGEFTLMLYRAFQFPFDGNTYSFSDVPVGSVYAEAVAAAKNLGVVQGSNGRFNPSSPITRQSAMTMICRAMAATGHTVPAVSATILSAYADGSQVAVYARPAVASLINMGVVKGNSSMQLKPTTAISRAEMAVILHRVLTR